MIAARATLICLFIPHSSLVYVAQITPFPNNGFRLAPRPPRSTSSRCRAAAIFSSVGNRLGRPGVTEAYSRAGLGPLANVNQFHTRFVSGGYYGKVASDNDQRDHRARERRPSFEGVRLSRGFFYNRA